MTKKTERDFEREILMVSDEVTDVQGFDGRFLFIKGKKNKGERKK